MTMERSEVAAEWEARPDEPMPIPPNLRQELHLKIMYQIGGSLITGYAATWQREEDVIQLSKVVLVTPRIIAGHLAAYRYTYYPGVDLIRVPLVIMPWSSSSEDREGGGDGSEPRPGR
jgi:hypothetical protein